MDQENRAALREAAERAARPHLAAALKALVATEARAAADAVDRPEDPTLGWFADGLDTALAVLFRELVGTEPPAAERREQVRLSDLVRP